MILLYIDPGTGSMLFTVLIGVIGAVVFFMRGFILKLKVWLGSDKSIKADQKRIPVVIYSDHKRYWNVFKPLCDEFEKRQQPVVYMTQSPDDPVLNAGYKFVEGEFIGEGNKGFARLNLLNANIVVSTTPGLDVYQWKRSKTVDHYVHICHSSWDINCYRMFGLDYYDAVLLNGEYQRAQIRELEQLRDLPEKYLEVAGQTYLDAMKQRYDAEDIPESERITVLLAPSWGPNSILCRFGERIIDALVATGYKIIIRPHPQSMTADREIIERLMESYPADDDLEWNFDNDNFDVLGRSGLMISDFSGVIFDYVFIFDKPLIYTDAQLDLSQYDAAWSKEELWITKTLPQIGIPLKEDDIPGIKGLVDRAIESRELTEGRERARDEAWQHRGESARLIVDYVMGKLEEEDTGKKDTVL